jgi:hypothetical protein
MICGESLGTIGGVPLQEERTIESRVANEKIFTEFLTEFMEAPLLITTEIYIKQREVKRHVRIRCPT